MSRPRSSIPRKEAFEQYSKTLGDSLFSRIEDRNPLPDSFIVVMHDLSKYDETVAQIRRSRALIPHDSQPQGFRGQAYPYQQPCQSDFGRGCFGAACYLAVHYREYDPRDDVLTPL